MANYYASARSNYFRVKDMAALKEWAGKLGIGVHEDESGRVSLLGNEDAGFPSHNPDTDEYVDIHDGIVPFLDEGSVAVFMEIGSEKLRYLSGHAFAVNSKGDSVWISLDEIYLRAEEKLGGEITRAEY